MAGGGGGGGFGGGFTILFGRGGGGAVEGDGLGTNFDDVGRGGCRSSLLSLLELPGAVTTTMVGSTVWVAIAITAPTAAIYISEQKEQVVSSAGTEKEAYYCSC